MDQRRASPNFVSGLFWASCACAVAGLVVLTIALRDVGQPFVPAEVAATALLAASAGWLFTNFVTLRLKTRERTFEYIREVTTKKELSSVSASVSKCWNRDKLSAGNPKDFVEYFLKTYPDGDLVKSLITLGNFFEELSIAVQLRAVDEKMLRRLFDEMLRVFMERLIPFLPSFRNDPVIDNHPYGISAPGVFEETMWLWRRWA